MTYLTKEKLDKIESHLLNKSKKDSDFPESYFLKGDETIPLLKGNLNRRLNVRVFMKELNKLNPLGIYNISSVTKKCYNDLLSAIEDVPEEYRREGQIVTFRSDEWKIYQFCGRNDEWNKKKKWSHIVSKKEEHMDYSPDDEDLEGFTIGDERYIRFKDREVGEFQSKGRVYLRKNIVPDELSTKEDYDGSCDCEYVNLLTQEMINKENTIYIVQYDYTLQEKTINIPKGSVLYLCGGSINDGTIVKSTDSSIVAYNAYIIGKNGILKVNTQNLVGNRIVINN